MKQKDFLKNLTNESNHRILLWYALEMTKGLNADSIGIDSDLVVEFGSGNGSTPFLKQYCEKNNRTFKTFENNREWAEKTGSQLITNWNLMPQQNCGVLFIDHAPGEQRKLDIEKNKNTAMVVVVHDTEIAADHGYQMRDVIFNNFEYIIELNPIIGGAGAIMCSNHIDFFHENFGKYDGFRITEMIKK